MILLLQNGCKAVANFFDEEEVVEEFYRHWEKDGTISHFQTDNQLIPLPDFWDKGPIGEELDEIFNLYINSLLNLH